MALVATLLIAMVSAAQADQPSLASMTRQTVERYIVPAYDDLVKATAHLKSEVHLYCTSELATSAASMLQPVIASWSRVEFLRFGPMADKNRQERFAFFPDPKTSGPRQMRLFLANVAAGKTQPRDIAGQSAAIQGLPALEMLLSGDFGALHDDQADTQRCDTAEAIAANMATIAQEAREGWSAYRAIMLEPGAQSPLYRNDREAATEILKALSTGLQQLREQRILPALGQSEGDAKPKQAPYYRSNSTLFYFKASTDALRKFARTSGIVDLLPEDSKWIGASIDFEFGNLDRTLAKLAGDRLFEETANRKALHYAVIVLNSLQDQFAVMLAGAIHLSPGFNALDGD